MEGNFAWGSAVRKHLNCGSGDMFRISFSSAGNQLVTRCRFLRHTQLPSLAAVRTSCNALSFCPPPMAISAKPTPLLLANSSISAEGSAPGVTTNSTGSPGVNSVSSKCDSDSAGGERLSTPSTSVAKLYKADSRRSGRTACTNNTRWNRDIFMAICPKFCSQASDEAHGCQTSSFDSCHFESASGNAARSLCSPCTRSGGHQLGAGPPASCGGT
mmetsp:Transcript_24582/g.62606  ORF Transcript_24582/g.62606 Transcript_24582/m.62606 type:complete len:215 (+) Transcript_24582:1712-2356(+)